MLGLKPSVNTKERLRKRSASGWTRGGALAKVRVINSNVTVLLFFCCPFSYGLQSTAPFIASLNLILRAVILPVGQRVRESHTARVLSS